MMLRKVIATIFVATIIYLILISVINFAFLLIPIVLSLMLWEPVLTGAQMVEILRMSAIIAFCMEAFLIWKDTPGFMEMVDEVIDGPNDYNN